jgi:hypothetical protein
LSLLPPPRARDRGDVAAGGTPVDARQPPAVAAIDAGAVVPAPDAAPCPAGQDRRPDTHGQCCWTGQAWSIARQRCVGRPSCPDGTSARGEDCAVADRLLRDPDPSPTATPRFRVRGRTFSPGGTIEVRFAAPIASSAPRRAWLTIVEANKPAEVSGSWDWVADGATRATLKAPTRPGVYEIRLHTDFPQQRSNVVHTVAITVAMAEAPVEPKATPAAQQRFTLASSTVAGGGRVELRFPAPMVAAKGERFWVTIVAHDAAASSWGDWAYVPQAARTLTLAVPDAPGDYEVRLHANYPTEMTNVVHRVRLRVD